MKLTIDEIIAIARRFETSGEIPEILEEFINLMVEENEAKKNTISARQEFGEDFLISTMKVLYGNKEKVKNL